MSEHSTKVVPDLELWGLLKAIINAVENVILIIDGLDECIGAGDWSSGGFNSREKFVETLKDIVTNTTTKVLIMSRDEADIRSQLQTSTLKPSDLTTYEL